MTDHLSSALKSTLPPPQGMILEGNAKFVSNSYSRLYGCVRLKIGSATAHVFSALEYDIVASVATSDFSVGVGEEKREFARMRGMIARDAALFVECINFIFCGGVCGCGYVCRRARVVSVCLVVCLFFLICGFVFRLSCAPIGATMVGIVFGGSGSVSIIRTYPVTCVVNFATVYEVHDVSLSC